MEIKMSKLINDRAHTTINNDNSVSPPATNYETGSIRSVNRGNTFLENTMLANVI